MIPLAQKTFSLADQEVFAALSGDWNPAHLDAVAARRTIFGGPVVHGVHGLLWLLGAAAPARGVASLEVRFIRPIRVGEPVEAFAEQAGSEGSTLVIMASGLAATRARVTWGEDAALPSAARRMWEAAAPLERTFEETEQEAGEEPLTWDAGAAQALFGGRCPAPAIGGLLAALTRIVGMRCPGRHSVFSGLRVRVGGPPGSAVAYKVTMADARFSSLRIGFGCGGCLGEMDVVHRPRPVAQPSLEDFRALVKPREFEGWRFLVVGGTRGLGEAAAKLVAAGGGRVCITFQSGYREAEGLIREGAAESALAFDVTSAAWPEWPWAPTHAAFFATPRIELDPARRGTADVLDRYRAVYVHAFGRLAERIGAAGSPCRILYPSTVFLDAAPPGAAEYCTAKAEGEALCAKLTSDYPSLRVFAPRIPRVATDQTATLVGTAGIPAAAALLPILRTL